MNEDQPGSRILIIIGNLAMLLGAIDPMEGSLLILPGSLLVAIGAWLGQSAPRLFAYRVVVFVLIAAGVGALWWLSSQGGFGGSSGHSGWWGLLILPYPVGWLMGIWGPGTPRWALWVGSAVGLWYLAISATSAWRPGHSGDAMSLAPALVLAVVGILAIAGCVYRLRGSGREAAA